MRSSLLFFLLCTAAAAHAQPQPQPQALPLPAGVPAAPSVPPARLGVATAPAPALAGGQGAPGGQGAQGVMTLSDVARQAPAEPPAPAAAATVASEVAPPLPADRGIRLRAQLSEFDSQPALSIILSRISVVGPDTSAVLWIKGRNRRVFTGERVLQYTVGEIREDGVCLYKAAGKAGNKCQQFVTFMQGV